MELNQEKKFVCKFCNKRYPCGKSLGGHIRIHMNNDNYAETKEESADLPLNKLKRFAGLRENPKKTKRFSDSSNGSSFKEMICKECGKGFRSMKALCGHMSCHSDKERVYHFNSGDKHKLIMDSQSNTETSTTPSRRRFKRVKYKTIGVQPNNSDNLGNGSSSVSEIGQEQEEVAMCLVMLSRDSCNKKGPNSVADSSDNNLLSLEEKSSLIDVRITIENAMKCVSNKNKLKESAETCHSSEDSDSGYFRNGPKKVESEDSVYEFRGSKKAKMVSGSGFKSKFKYDLRRNGKNAYYSPQMGSKYECLTCNKTFDSHRALGGHRASHKKANDCNESIHESRIYGSYESYQSYQV
ncbi:zinc finger protein ZAT1-like [Hibiscus syriacus]|uniref:zinc finger protein ZAT1-like n=1 Tax=Hibiscus syriacus TaxID=106335 RepID=UPI0019215ABB|nr:zinc finger protein ZAT1-like [Hibiscus syriacus]